MLTMQAKPLTFEQTKGTKTYYLPFERGPETPPEATVMVRRLEDGTYIAGVSVRSLEEPFVKLEGRFRAYNRMLHAPYGRGAFRAADGDDLAAQIEEMFLAISVHHPGTVSMQAIDDLEDLTKGLSEAFDRLDKNREERLAKALAANA